MNYWVESYTAGSSAVVWVKVPSVPSGNSTIYMYYGNPSATSASNPDSTLIFWDDFSTNPNTNGKWTVYRYQNNTSNEFWWNSSSGTLYLTTAVNDMGSMGFINKPINYPFFVEFRFLAGGGTGADGMFFTFDKNIMLYQTYGRSGAAEWCTRAFDGSNYYDSDGWALELDNYDNGTNDPSANYIAVVRTLNWNGGWPIQGSYYNTGATEDNNWHTIEMGVTSSRVDFVKLDGSTILTNSPISSLGYNRAGFGGGTGGLNNNHIIDYVKIRKYASPEPTTSVGAEESATGTTTTPVIAPAYLCRWNTITYNVETPSGSSIVVDILDAAGNVIMSNVSSGANISSITQTQIRLRATLSTTNPSSIPSLLDWTITYYGLP